MTELLTDRDIADRLGMRGTRWVRDQARAGVFPSLKVGRHRRYTEEHFAQILRICEQEATPRKRPEPAPQQRRQGAEIRQFERKTPHKLRERRSS